MTNLVHIDDIDVKILKTLLKDPRTSFVKIAKHCKMSINAIRMRFKRLEESGVINGSILQVNPKSLGYDCIAFLMIRADTNNTEKVLKFLNEIPEIFQTFEQIGRTNIHCVAALENVDELAHTIENVRKHPNIIDVDAIIWVDVIKMDHTENLVIKPLDGLAHTAEFIPNDADFYQVKNDPNVFSEPLKEECVNTAFEFDNIDRLILGMLSENARLPFRKIAEQLGISTQSVIRRYNRLRLEVLPYSSITLDLRKFGYIGTALFLIKVSHEQDVSQVLANILEVPNVITAIRTLGNFDIFVAAPFSDYENIFKLNQSITRISGVMQIELLWGKPFYKWPLNLFSKLVQKQAETT